MPHTKEFMTDSSQNRLDRIDATLDRVGERLDLVSAQQVETAARQAEITIKQARNADDIDTLLGAVSSNEVACRELRISIVENQDRFTVLREEAQADRAETRRLSNEANARFERMQQEAAAANARFEQLQREATEANARFEQLRREAAEDRRRADERYAAQMEVTQTLLLELTKTNRNVSDLRDRVDTIDQAAS